MNQELQESDLAFFNDLEDNLPPVKIKRVIIVGPNLARQILRPLKIREMFVRAYYKTHPRGRYQARMNRRPSEKTSRLPFRGKKCRQK